MKAKSECHQRWKWQVSGSGAITQTICCVIGNATARWAMARSARFAIARSAVLFLERLGY